MRWVWGSIVRRSLRWEGCNGTWISLWKGHQHHMLRLRVRFWTSQEIATSNQVPLKFVSAVIFWHLEAHTLKQQRHFGKYINNGISIQGSSACLYKRLLQWQWPWRLWVLWGRPRRACPRYQKETHPNTPRASAPHWLDRESNILDALLLKWLRLEWRGSPVPSLFLSGRRFFVETIIALTELLLLSLSSLPGPSRRETQTTADCPGNQSRWNPFEITRAHVSTEIRIFPDERIGSLNSFLGNLYSRICIWHYYKTAN